MSSEINAVFKSVDVIDSCLEFTNKIKGALYQIAHNFVYIGFLLAECNDYQTYKEWGYNSIYEYALEQFNFKKSSVNNFINVCKTFSSNFSNHGHNLPYSMVLKDGYADFNYSQLVEMLSMSEKQRSRVTPDMTIKQIREVKKSAVEPEYAKLYNMQLKFIEFDVSYSCKKNGKPFKLRVYGAKALNLDIYPDGYYISVWISYGSSGSSSPCNRIVDYDKFKEYISSAWHSYDNIDDSRRLEYVPEEAPAPDTSDDSEVIKKADYDLLELHSSDISDLFNEIEEASLSSSGIDSPLYEVAMQIFKNHNYVIYQKSK